MCIYHVECRIFRMKTAINPWWRHHMKTFSASLALCEGIHRWSVDSPHKGWWRRVLVFSLICAWTNGWANNWYAGDLRRHRAHRDLTVMKLDGSSSYDFFFQWFVYIYLTMILNSNGISFFMDDPCINFYQRYFDSDMIMYSNLFTFTCVLTKKFVESRPWTHKRHTIFRNCGRAMRCLLQVSRKNKPHHKKIML